MTKLVNLLLSKETMCVPEITDEYVGRYNLSLSSNATPWILFLWYILHFLFEQIINLLLKKMRIKEYVRTRLKRSIWFLLFYGTCFIYCLTLLHGNNSDLFNYQKIVNNGVDFVVAHKATTLVIFCTFYLHCVIWEVLYNGFSVTSLSYLLMGLFIWTSFLVRKMGLCISLLIFVSIYQCGIELIRCTVTLLRSNSFVVQLCSKFLLCIALCLIIAIHLIIVPFTFLIPLWYNLTTDNNTISIALLNIIVWLWLLTEVTNSPLYKLVHHWMFHSKYSSKTKCLTSFIECSLFQPRDDVAYHLSLLRKEIKEREARMISLRKPKNRNMLVQTLKCMVAIKKKLRQKGEHNDLEYNEQEECEQESNGEIKNDDSKELKRYSWDESYNVEDQRNATKFSKSFKGYSKHISDDEDSDSSDEH